jgi:hypothetical protein
MGLKDLMVISGHPGIYRFISQGRNSIIVESLEDKKRMSAYASSKISSLEEIAVFTETGEIPLADVFKRIYEHTGGKPVPGNKPAEKEIRGFFAEMVPEYDRDRVYVSDMKKVINWYNQLLDYGLLEPDPETGDSGSSPGPEVEGETAEGGQPADTAAGADHKGEPGVDNPKDKRKTEKGSDGSAGPDDSSARRDKKDDKDSTSGQGDTQRKKDMGAGAGADDKPE